MTERDGFLANILAGDQDCTKRLVFADWLDEHGEEELAEELRLEAVVASGSPRFITDTDRRSAGPFFDVFLRIHVLQQSGFSLTAEIEDFQRRQEQRASRNARRRKQYRRKKKFAEADS